MGMHKREYNQTFIKPVSQPAQCCRKTKGIREKYDIRNGHLGCREPGREVLRAQASLRLVFGFSNLSPQPANSLCASYFLLFCHHKSATVVNAFPKSLHIDKKVGTFKKTFSIITDFFYPLKGFFVDHHNYNIRLSPCIQSSQKNSTDSIYNLNS